MSKTIQGYADSYRAMQRAGAENIGIFSIIHDLERNMVQFTLDKPKDHQIANFVNDLKSISNTYNGTGQLRARISSCVNDFLNQLK